MECGEAELDRARWKRPKQSTTEVTLSGKQTKEHDVASSRQSRLS